MKLSKFMKAQALRSTIELQPIEGPNGRFFPPTYPPAEGSRDGMPRHVVEELPNGERRVLVDSVASQANRQEAALVAARDRSLIDFADVYVQLSNTDAGIEQLSATEMPHRLSDAILRDSEIDGVSFAKSEIGQGILRTNHTDLSVILETSPTTLLFGCWFSQYNLPRPLKIQRATTSEIWAHNAVLGQAVGSRIDPLGIEKLQLYETPDGNWTALPEKAALQQGDKPKPFAKKRPSKINHGNIAPSVRQQGITAERISLCWAVPLAAIRRLHFGGNDRDLAGQAYILALGVLARVLDHHAGYSLRSRCDLISSGPMSIDVIDGDGAITPQVVTLDDALGLFREAEGGMQKAELSLHGKIFAQPSTQLIDLIKANKQAQELDKEPAA